MNRMETERLILRRWEEEDLHDLHRYAQDREVALNTGWHPHTSMEESEAMLKRFMSHEETWAVCLKETGRAVGHIRLTPNPNKGKWRAKSVSYALSRECWGQGLMSEALHAVVRYAFEETDADRLTAFRYPENVRSGRMLEKCGFEYEGTLPGSIRRMDGTSCDAVCYLMTKEEYERR